MKNRILFLVGLLITGLYLFPLYWMYVTSLKSGSDIFAVPPTFLPPVPNWGAFPDVWFNQRMARLLWNSLVIAFGTTTLTAAIGIGAAYVLARYRTIWIDVALFMILLLQVLPQSLMITPLFVGFSQLGLLDYPRFAVIIALAAKTTPFFIILCRASFMSVPRELEEAALVEGNSRVGAFFFIALPLARNGILVSTILIFMQSYGEFVYSKSIIQSSELQTASIGLNSFMGPNTNEWNKVMAFAAIYVTPILLAFALLQRRIVSGLTSGALK